jgi:uncharacterized phiE125 gp8 family phage protein
MSPARYRLQVLSQPAVETVTLAEAKAYLRITHSDEDAALTLMVQAVRDTAERYMGRSLVRRGWRLLFENCVPIRLHCPMGPVLSVDSVSTYDRETNLTTLVGSGDYYLSLGYDRITFIGQLSADRITVDYYAGYGTAATDVPPAIREGMLAHIAALYGDREGAAAMPNATRMAYAPYATVRI